MLRDVLTRREGGTRRAVVDPPPETKVTVTAATEPHDEPTWEVRHPDKRRVDNRTKSILAAAAAAALVVNAGAAWAYWRVMAAHGGTAKPGTTVELQLRGRSDLNVALTPGRTGNLTVTVTNDNDFPIRITSVAPGTGNVVADDEHRDAGCRVTGVSMARPEFAVSWDVARNTVGAFVVPDGLIMSRSSGPACHGATFTVPVQTTGVSSGR
jgi:uncharacterized cupredoxin-like copper-binding protein